MNLDKNFWIAMGLMLLVVIGFTWYQTPSQEQMERARHYRDSVQAVNKAKQKAEAEKEAQQDSLLAHPSDSVRTQQYGTFAVASKGEEKTIVIENKLLKVEFSTKGGVAKKVVLKEYNDYQGNPLTLFQGDEESFDLELAGGNGKVLNTSDLYFATSNVTDSTVTFTLANAEGGQLIFSYLLPDSSYMMNFDIETKNLAGALSSTDGTRLIWKNKLRQHEKSQKFENRYASLAYKIHDDTKVVELSNSGTNDEAPEEDLHWVAFKDQFFSQVLIADGAPISRANLKSIQQDPKSGYLQDYSADVRLSFDPTKNEVSKYRFFYGPNKYSLLRSYDSDLSGNDKLKLNRLIPLGIFLFRWVNQIIIIPLFNLLGSWFTNYGLIIFLLTLIIKLIIFPLTYKSYLSTAMMRVLRPEIEKMQKDIPEENMAERQQVTMQVYSKAGVSPMSGCMPMLLQMPILIAMFTFFPTSIELRGQSFLWADDLSSYDAIVSWSGNIPFVTEYFGNHISLFCLLLFIVNLVYTKINMQMNDTGANQQMAGMKYMMYFMPFMLLFMFNDYASGLSYYYFISLLITIAQTYGMRYFIDDDKLMKKIHEKSKQKQMSTSSWMDRMVKMQEQMKKQQEMMDQQRREQNRK